MKPKKVKLQNKKSKAPSKTAALKRQAKVEKLYRIDTTLVSNLRRFRADENIAQLRGKDEPTDSVVYKIDGVDETGMSIRISNTQLGEVKAGEFIAFHHPDGSTGIIFRQDLEKTSFPTVYTDISDSIENN